MTADEFGLRGWELQKEDGSPTLFNPPNKTTPMDVTSIFQECIEAANGYQLIINNTKYDGNVSFRVFVEGEEQGPDDGAADLISVEVLSKDDMTPNGDVSNTCSPITTPPRPPEETELTSSATLEFSSRIMATLFSMVVATTLLWYL